MALKQDSRVTSKTIETALERFKLAAEADSDWRAKCLDDLDFSIGNQWPLTIQTIREKDGRPCLVMDQIQQSIRLVCNQYRQQPPSITVSPVGDGADVKTADIIQGVIRHIEVNCDAQIAYEKTHEGMVRAGFHSCRLLSEYVDDDSEDQEIVIEWIRNAFSVYWQPGVPQEKARWCFIVVDLPRDTFKAEYPDSDLASSSDFTSIGNAAPEWDNEEYIRVAEYFEVVDVDRGKNKRPGKKVLWRKITAYETLEGGEEGQELPGTSIPVFTAYADDIDVDGKRYVAGLVRNAKGPQRQYNYMVSGATEAVSLASKAQWLVVEGQLSGRETQWEQANFRLMQVLQYKQVDIGGKPAPAPERVNSEPQIQGLSQMIGQASNDLKASLGLYDPSMGNAQADQSGRAIQSLQQQGNIATLNYSDNMGRMLKRVGKSLLEWMKAIYDEPRVQRIIQPDSTVQHVIIHNGKEQAAAAQKMAQELAGQQQPGASPSEQPTTPQQIAKIYDIGVGRYDIVISIEQNYQTKRKEAAATQIDLMKALPPQQASAISDLAVRNMDIPQSDEMADRIKRMQPPQILGGDETDPQAQLQQAQSQLQQFSQQHALQQKAIEEMSETIKSKTIENQSKMQIAQMQELTKQEIVKMQEATKIAVAQINASKAAQESIADAEIQAYDLLHSAAHDIAMQKDQQAHQQGMAQQQQVAATQNQQSDQQLQQQQSQQADQGEQQPAQQQETEPAGA